MAEGGRESERLVPPAPPASSDAVRQRMQRQADRDTTPEMELRRRLHARGYRYRVDIRPVSTVRRRADIVFTRRLLAVFVDGCFWHSCPEHGHYPSTNHEWWKAKLDRTRERDRETNAELRRKGWGVIRVWEHEDPTAATERVIKVLEG